MRDRARLHVKAQVLHWLYKHAPITTRAYTVRTSWNTQLLQRYCQQEYCFRTVDFNAHTRLANAKGLVMKGTL
jgi:hypothetical protein